MSQFSATVGDHDYTFSASDLAGLNLTPLGANRYHLLHDGRGYSVEVLRIDRARKRLDLRVNGRELTVDIRDEVDLLVRQLGFATVETSVGGDVHAPMPGLVLDILVEPGQEVEVGTPLLVLEAMKMENVIKAEGAGRVTDIHVERRQAVEKRQLLVGIEN